MDSSSLYVYGFVRTAEAPDLGPSGIAHDGRPARVYPVPAGKVAAMVSAHGATQPVLPLRRNLEPHHRVVAELSRTTTVVPVAFGHVVRGARELKSFLRLNAAAIGAELDRLEGKVEMGVRVRWDVQNIFKYIVDGDAVLAASRDRLFGGGAEAAPADKLELGRMFEERLQAARAALSQRVLDSLEPKALASHSNPPTNDETVADLAFLVERGQERRFEESVGEVAALWPAEYVFHCTGPWAPFNFVEVQLSGTTGAGDHEWAC